MCEKGHRIRIAGQGVERGTFLERHAVLQDQESQAILTALKIVSKDS